ncbi:MAG: MobA/MobL family protein [Acetobacteraceae bacterium]
MAAAAHYHLTVKSIGRSTRGGGVKNATAAAAYRSGGVVEMACYRAAEATLEHATGQVHDYTRKTGVLESHLLLPEGAPDWNRSRLWNEAERAEPRKNGRIATEIEVALPKELSRDQQRELALGFAQGIVDRYHVAADVNLHQGKHPDNVHAHMMFSHRELGPQGFGDIANRHPVEKGGRQVEVAGLVAQSRDVEPLRAEWERHVNRAYERAGHELRVDHRSYQRQGVSQEPTRYLGPRQSDPERKRLREERADYNERIMARRQERERQAIDRAVRQRQAAHEDPARARLRSMGAEALDREAAVDTVPSGWRPMEVRDLARQLSPDFSRALGEADRLRADLRRADWQLGRHEADTRDYAAKREARWHEMSVFQKALDWTGFHGDKALQWNEAGQARSYAAYQKAAIHRGALAGRLKMAERCAEMEFETVRPAAEAALPALRERAALAREIQDERLAQRERLAAAPRAEQKVQTTQKQVPVAAQTQTPRTKAEEQEEAVDRYVQGMIARHRSRPEQQAEEEREAQRLARKQSQSPPVANPAAAFWQRTIDDGRQQRQGAAPREKQQRRQGQAMSQEERAKAYWQGLAARGRALKDEGEEERLRQTQRQTLRHGPRMGM